MIYKNADADQKPQKVTVETLPGGNRAVRLADNIQEYFQEDAENRKMYRFDEVNFMIPISETVTTEEIEEEFAKWWKYGQEDYTEKEPGVDDPEPETMTRAELSEAIKLLQKDNEALKERNTMLEECLIEMSEIVYA